MNRSDMRSWALKGAEQRLVEIAEEAKNIFKTFPDLRRRRVKLPESVVTGAVGESARDGSPRRNKRKMSAKAKKAIAVAQRKRWAEWRKKNRTSA
jgi:hypothetical protein